MITKTMMYWIVMLDNFCIATIFIWIVCGAFAIVGLVKMINNYEYNSADKKDKDYSCGFLMLKIFGPVFVVSFLLSTFMPTSKQLAAIYVIPAIVNNEKVQDMGTKSLDIGVDLLDLTKQYLEEKIKK